jgi:hypothetical protein
MLFATYFIPAAIAPVIAALLGELLLPRLDRATEMHALAGRKRYALLVLVEFRTERVVEINHAGWDGGLAELRAGGDN